MKSLAISVLLLAVLTVAVYHAKHRAGEARQEIAILRSELAGLQEEMAVLRAEEAHLARPERIADLARTHLGLAPPRPEQFIDNPGQISRPGSMEKDS